MLKQVFLINTDLGMRKGKIAVQVAHGEVYYMSEIENALFEEDSIANYENYQKWLNTDMPKIVLRSTEEQMKHMMNELKDREIWYHEVHDKGYTQVEPDSFTCLVVEPLEEETYNELFKQFKLL